MNSRVIAINMTLTIWVSQSSLMWILVNVHWNLFGILAEYLWLHSCAVKKVCTRSTPKVWQCFCYVKNVVPEEPFYLMEHVNFSIVCALQWSFIIVIGYEIPIVNNENSFKSSWIISDFTVKLFRKIVRQEETFTHFFINHFGIDSTILYNHRRTWDYRRLLICWTSTMIANWRAFIEMLAVINYLELPSSILFLWNLHYGIN